MMIHPANNNSLPGWQLIRLPDTCGLFGTTGETMMISIPMFIWLFQQMEERPSLISK